MQRIFGVQPVDLPQWQDRWTNLIHPQDRARTTEAASGTPLRGGPRYDVEYRVVRPDGTVRVVHSQGDVVRDDSGRPCASSASCRTLRSCGSRRTNSPRSRSGSECWLESSLTGIYLTELRPLHVCEPSFCEDVRLSGRRDRRACLDRI